jgi:hypothetical protein
LLLVITAQLWIRCTAIDFIRKVVYCIGGHVLVPKIKHPHVRVMGDEMNIFKVITSIMLGVLFLLTAGCTTVPVRELSAQPVAKAAVRVDTRTDFRPEVINHVLTISGNGFVEHKYVQSETEISETGVLIEFTGSKLPTVRIVSETDDPGTIKIQVDNYVFEEYSGQLLSVSHGPTGAQTTANPVIYYALHREIFRMIRRLHKEPPPAGAIRL